MSRILWHFIKEAIHICVQHAQGQIFLRNVIFSRTVMRLVNIMALEMMISEKHESAIYMV